MSSSRRSFFSKCASFVAGCALGVGIARKPIDPWEGWSANYVGGHSPEFPHLVMAVLNPSYEKGPVTGDQWAYVMSDGRAYTISKEGNYSPVDISTWQYDFRDCWTRLEYAGMTRKYAKS